ncbi:hypothetical protein LIER_03343 [Lithospermum erythrorhizon]|uniref:Uncharacterized protein n=1 Tax=Lithospermum erythrorhizon TaxID=34254 RepID=A0AAV3NTJ3_LITER
MKPPVSYKEVQKLTVECTTRPPQQVSGPEESRPKPTPQGTLYLDGARNRKGKGYCLLTQLRRGRFSRKV